MLDTHRFARHRWLDGSNNKGCGIYCMRHLETYMGITTRLWCTGFEKTENIDQVLKKLRQKYTAKILTSDMNRERENLAKKINVWSKKPAQVVYAPRDQVNVAQAVGCS